MPSGTNYSFDVMCCCFRAVWVNFIVQTVFQILKWIQSLSQEHLEPELGCQSIAEHHEHTHSNLRQLRVTCPFTGIFWRGGRKLENPEEHMRFCTDSNQCSWSNLNTTCCATIPPSRWAIFEKCVFSWQFLFVRFALINFWFALICSAEQPIREHSSWPLLLIQHAQLTKWVLITGEKLQTIKFIQVHPTGNTQLK